MCSVCRTEKLDPHYRHFLLIFEFLKNPDPKFKSVDERNECSREPQNSDDCRITRVLMADVAFGAL